MRILILHNRYLSEGGEDQALDIQCQALRAGGHQVEVYQRSSREWSAHNTIQRLGDALESLYSLRTVHDLRSILRRFQPHIAHLHNVFPVISPSAYLTLHAARIPIFQTIHNFRFMCANGLFLRPDGSLCERCKDGNFWFAVRWGCYRKSRLQTLPMATSLAYHHYRKTWQRTIHTFLAPSGFTRLKLIEAGFPADRIHVLPNAVAPAASLSSIRSPTPLFVYAGRLSPEKGLNTLLRAFQGNAMTVLHVLGDGPLREDLLRRAETNHNSHIRFLGHLPKETLLEHMRRAWALIMPSECYENFPQAILESWQAGTPVLLSDHGGLHELLRNDGTAMGFQPGSVESLQNAIHTIVDSGPPTPSVAQRCRSRIDEWHAPDRICRRLIELYEQALA